MIQALIILSLIVIIVSVVSFFVIKGLLKKSKEKEGTIKQLRKVITEMVELDGDKKDIEIERKKIKKNVDSMSDHELSIAYNNQLPNMPKKRTRKSKNT